MQQKMPLGTHWGPRGGINSCLHVTSLPQNAQERGGDFLFSSKQGSRDSAVSEKRRVATEVRCWRAVPWVPRERHAGESMPRGSLKHLPVMGRGKPLHPDGPLKGIVQTASYGLNSATRTFSAWLHQAPCEISSLSAAHWPVALRPGPPACPAS